MQSHAMPRHAEMLLTPINATYQAQPYHHHQSLLRSPYRSRNKPVPALQSSMTLSLTAHTHLRIRLLQSIQYRLIQALGLRHLRDSHGVLSSVVDESTGTASARLEVRVDHGLETRSCDIDVLGVLVGRGRGMLRDGVMLLRLRVRVRLRLGLRLVG